MIRLTEEVKPMPIVVRPEDIRLSKKKLRKDICIGLVLKKVSKLVLKKDF